ncbi:hypothetical protein [Erythrobacter sp. F6033]|uniref:hypothetical protein n=1 Tax=Erythrobacter sp. F6033 TaxID=2926401 RepID=UPI001FF21D48|nr:hypothetical protein [Erythrobacter sp. F6033]MCK0128436.1 hypothetical protein [Erythrobacter sp. F6033]
MPQLDGYEYVPFPFDALSPQSGELTWIKEFEDSPVEGAVIEFPIPYAALPGDTEHWSSIDPERGTTLTLEAPLPLLPTSKLAGSAFNAEDGNPEAFSGSVYLGDRHHPIDLYNLAFADTRSGLTLTVHCLVLFTFEGISAGDDVEYDDTEWKFSAPITVRNDAHNYREGPSPSAFRRILRLFK